MRHSGHQHNQLVFLVKFDSPQSPPFTRRENNVLTLDTDGVGEVTVSTVRGSNRCQ